MTRIGFVRNAIARKPTLGFGSAVTLATLLTATAARFLLGSSADDAPFATFYPAIMICTLLAGLRYGLASFLVSVAIVRTQFLPQEQSFYGDFRSAAPLLVLLFSCLIIIAISESLRRTFRELEAKTAQLKVLNRELHHRVRNSISVVQALAQQSSRSNPDKFLPAFLERLRALAQAHDVIAHGDPEKCDLKLIIDRCCSPFCHEGNISSEGPECCVPSESCVPLSLAIHELCTNATKHGALSATGQVQVHWIVDNGIAKLTWQESGGPKVLTPTRRGLGTALLSSQRNLKKVDLQFNPQGVRCDIEIEGVT